MASKLSTFTQITTKIVLHIIFPTVQVSFSDNNPAFRYRKPCKTFFITTYIFKFPKNINQSEPLKNFE